MPNLEGNESEMDLRHMYYISHQRLTPSPAITAFLNPPLIDCAHLMETELLTLRMIRLPRSVIKLLVSLRGGIS
jgi:hypothetical protein